MGSKVVRLGQILGSCEIIMLIGQVLTEILTSTEKYLSENAQYHEYYQLYGEKYEKQSCSTRRDALDRRSSRPKS